MFGQKGKKAIYILLAAAVLLAAAAGCASRAERETFPVFDSYREIPGVTDAEINAITALKVGKTSFVYGMEESTECFVRADGSIGGFAALFTDWLGGLFGVEIEPRIYEWDELLAGLDDKTIDFSGDITPTGERRQIYHMTSPIAARPVMQMWLADADSPAEIAAHRPMRYVFTEMAVAYSLTADAIDKTNEIIFASNSSEAYEMLKSGEADVFIEEGPYEAYFDKYGGIRAEQFYPIANSPVSLTTGNPELSCIISVVQKALESGANRYLTQMYSKGYEEYIQQKFSLQLTEAERAYIQAHTAADDPIPVGFEADNYPTCFYNEREGAYQGIAPDVLGEIEKLTGLRFVARRPSGTDFTELLEMLESGEVSIVTEVIPIPARVGRYIFSDPYASDYYALITPMELEDLNLNDILYLKIGLQNNVAYTEMFHQWFPNHTNTVALTDAVEAIGAMERGEIDAYMGTRKLLLQATNYMEKPAFKANIVFNRSYDSTFGINLKETTLRSIINKAQQHIDTDRINERWVTRVFNYESAIANARMPYLIGIIALMLGIIWLLAVMFYKGRRLNARLSAAVARRTRELEEQMKLAIAASESKSRFLATMSHEIRTPMNAIIGITQIELQDKDNPKAEAFGKIYDSGMGLLGIINDILDLSKIETGKLELSCAEYDVAKLIHDAVQLNAVRIGDKPIKLILDVSENLPSKLYGDELRLKQILNNLLSNAIKYTDKGSIELMVRCGTWQNEQLSLYDEQRKEGEVNLTFIVSDTGQGIKPEDLKQLFTEYLRFYADANRTTEGTGLGLNITKKLVDLMEGTINAESKYGEGSTFTVTVRQKSAGSETIGAELAGSLENFTFSSGRKADEQTIERHPMPYGRVLIVDDVASNLYVAQGLLTPYELSVEKASSGFEVIEKVSAGAVYDIIFMDHMMPHMDGIETTGRLREHGYEGVIVALTANALAGNEEMFRENGFDGFIPKPIDIEHLDAVLNKFIRDRYSGEV